MAVHASPSEPNSIDLQTTFSESAPQLLAIVDSSDLQQNASSDNEQPEEVPKRDKFYLLDGIDNTWLNQGLESLEQFQVWLGSHVQSTTEGIDDYFGTEEAFERSRGSRLDIMTPMTFHDSGQVEMSMRLRAKFALPKIERRWHLLITTEDTSVKGQVNNDLAREVIEEEGTASFGFQVALEDFNKLATLLDFGMNFKNTVEPDPYIRLKKRYEWNLRSNWVGRMGQDVFWERFAGPGLNSKLVFDKRLDKEFLFRTQSNGTWWQQDGYYELTEQLLLYQQLNSYRLLTYQTWLSWDTQGVGVHNTGYGASVNWRERAYKNWLYFEVQPGVTYSEDNDFKQADWTLMLMLEMRFFQSP
ncbi:hypothetical protein [Thiomicrorhabdus sp.]|uniref:hypothetical protein n=1 Tax=Thiomicrorhabdus sp. TaxID=2039724 RepID=UPI00356810C3